MLDGAESFRYGGGLKNLQLIGYRIEKIKVKCEITLKTR